MKSNRVQSAIILLVLLFLTTNTMAINLGIGSFSENVNPNPIGTNSEFTVSASIFNSTDTGSPATANTVEITVDNFGIDTGANFSFVNASGTNGFSCTPTGTPVTSVTCIKTMGVSELPADDFTQVPFSFKMNAGSLPISIVDFDFLVRDTVLANDTVSTINTATFNGSVQAVATSPDFGLAVGPTGSPINIDSNHTASLPFSFDLNNSGTASGNSFEEIVYITVADNFALASLNMVNIISTGLANWNCNIVGGSAPTDNDWECTNVESVGGMAVNDSARITGNITSYVTANNTSAALTATIASSSDFNGANNSVDIDIVINAATPPDMAVTLIDIDNVTSVTSLDFQEGSFTAQSAHFRVTNSIAVATNGATLSFSYDDTQFSLSQTTLPGGWGCTNPTTGQLDCSIGTLINIGDTLDFFFDYAPIQTLSVGNFASLDVSIFDADFAEPGATQNDNNVSVPVNVVGTTDLEVKKFVKDTVGGSIITNVDQDTQFVYSIQVNNLSTVAANNITVTDNIPAGIEITSAAQSNGNWSCNVGAFVDEFTSQLVTCSRLTMPASQPNFSEFIYLDAFGRVSSPSPINNTAFISALDETDSNTGNDGSTASVTIDSTDFDVFPTVNLVTFNAGGFDNGGGKIPPIIEIGTQGDIEVLADARLQVALSKSKNLKNQPVLRPAVTGASNVVLTAVIPTGLSYVSHSVIGPNFVCAYNGVDTVSCTTVNLPDTTSDDGVLITVNADGPAGTAVDFSASIAADAGSNVNTFNDTDDAQQFTIIAAPIELDLTISKDAQFVGGSISNNEFLVGQSFEYKLIATNQNGNIAQPGDVEVYDFLPFNVDLDATPNSAGWDCSGVGPQTKSRATTKGSGVLVSCINTVAIAANGGSLELIIPVSSQIVGAYSNTGYVDVSSFSSAFENFTSDNSAVFNINIVAALTPTTLSVTKDALVSGSPVTSVNSGSIYTYRVDVGNTGNSNAVDIVVVDTMPTGVSVLNTNGTGWNCSNIGQQYSCTFPGPLLPGSNSFVDFSVREATAVGTLSILNNVDVTAGNAPLQSASNSVDVIRPTLNVSVTQNPNPIDGGLAFDLSVVINNTGNSSLAGIQVENTLPDGFSYGAMAKASTCTQNGLVMSCSVNNSIAPGASETITIPVNAIGLVDTGATYTNTTVVSGSNLTTPVTNTTILSVNQADFDVGISKSASVSSVAPNSPFSYTLSVVNLGNMDATGITVIDDLPTGVQLVSINAPDWSCNGTTQIVCTQTSLAVGVSSNIVVNVTSPSVVGSVNNVAQVSISELDTNTSNDQSQVGVDVMSGVVSGPAIADLQLTKTTSTPMLISGEQYSWQIDILNLGPDTASTIVVNDLLPTGFEFDSVTTSAGTCQETLIDITCEIPFIFNQDTVSIIVTGIATIDSGQLESTATIVSTVSTDLDPNNDSGSVDVMVNPRDVDLAVSIDSGDNIDQGDTSEFVINVLNNGPSSAHSPELNIEVAGLIEEISVAQGSDWTCQATVLVIACQFNDLEMINGQMSSVALTVKTDKVVIEAEDLVVTATAVTTNVDIDSNIDNNTATSTVGVEGTPTEGEIADAIRDALGVGDPEINDAIDAVSALCEIQFFTAFEALCESIFDSANEGDREALARFIDEITPREVIGQSTSLNEIALAQFRNIGARLNQLRGGGGSGFSSAGLNARYGSGSIPLGMLAYLNQTEEEAAAKIDTNNDFISPWGFFVNGSISMGERDATGRELGFDFDTFGLTAGLDYRIDAKKVVGVAVGYANFDSEIEGSAELKSTGVTLTGYGSFYVNDNFYVDARISLGKPDFEQSRKIDFTLGDTHFDRTAVGDTTASQYTVSMSAGYSFYKKAWNITPNASFTYTTTDVDSFTESGAGDFNIVYSEQEIESLVWSAGVRVSKAISLKNGVITPQFDFDYNYQGLNDDSLIEVRFINSPESQAFYLETDSPDRTYGSAGAGLVYISANGKQAYFNYRSVLGLDGFSRGTYNIGARFEF